MGGGESPQSEGRRKGVNEKKVKAFQVQSRDGMNSKRGTAYLLRGGN